MLRLLSTVLTLLFFATAAFAQTAPDAAELTKLLNDFLAGAGRNDVAMHDRFWAEDLIYTGAAGRRVSKADIMKDLRSSPTLSNEQKTTYSAEDVRIQQYGTTAIVAFRLVAKVEKIHSTDVTRYFNTGTFLKRDGKWQVVSWQATRLPRTEAETRKELASVEETLNRATLGADTKTLEQILDEGFIWTQQAGEQVTREQFIENLRSGKLKYFAARKQKRHYFAIGRRGHHPGRDRAPPFVSSRYTRHNRQRAIHSFLHAYSRQPRRDMESSRATHKPPVVLEPWPSFRVSSCSFVDRLSCGLEHDPPKNTN